MNKKGKADDPLAVEHWREQLTIRFGRKGGRS